VSATAAGTSVSMCSDNCNLANTTNRSLHIGNPAFTIFTTSVGADTGSTYLTGVFCGSGICSITNKRAESPTINCSGKSGITASFLYYENGEGALDDATFVYSADGGTTWNTKDAIAKTTTTCTAPSGNWTALTVSLPVSANNNSNVKVGFNWTNNGTGGTDPSFAVDDIMLNSTTTYVAPVVPYSSDLMIYSSGKNIVIETQSTFKVISGNDILGKKVANTVSGNTISLTESKPGIYFVQLEVKGILITKKVLITQ